MGEHTRTVEYTLRHTHITRHRHPTQLSQNMAAQQSGGQSAKVDHPKANTANTANNSQFSHAREYKDGEPEHHHAPPDSHEALTAGTLAQEKGNRHFQGTLEETTEQQKEEFSAETASHRRQSGSQASSGGAKASSTGETIRGPSTNTESDSKTSSNTQSSASATSGSTQGSNKEASGAGTGATDSASLEADGGDASLPSGKSTFSHANEFGSGPPPGVADHKHAAEGSVEALAAGSVAQDHGNSTFIASLNEAKEKQEDHHSTAI